MLNEIDRITSVTTFNGVAILSGGSISIQIGANNTSNDQISLTLTSTATCSSGLSVSGTDLTTNTNAGTALDTIKTAIETVTTGLATLGANDLELTCCYLC